MDGRSSDRGTLPFVSLVLLRGRHADVLLDGGVTVRHIGLDTHLPEVPPAALRLARKGRRRLPRRPQVRCRRLDPSGYRESLEASKGEAERESSPSLDLIPVGLS